MNKRSKIIFIGLLFGFALVMGIYLYPHEESMVVGQNRNTPEKTAPQQVHKKVTGADEKNIKLSPAALPKDQAGLADRPKAAPSDNNSYVVYPEKILEMIGIDMEKVIAERDAYKNTVTHVEWMDRINEVLKNLDPEKKAAMIKNHTSLLYIKDLLNEAYLSGKIDHETFIKAVADLMKWHQQTYQSMLTESEYEALFELKPEVADDMIDGFMEAAPRYSFILNQQIPAEEVTKQVQGYKLEQVDSHFKKMILDRDQIGKRINSGEMTLDQAREALNKSQQAFIAQCKELLTEEEINTIFGSVTALESGATQTEAPVVEGDSDIKELGFMIENPTTSIEMIKGKIDKQKLEDIKFFYEQTFQEREELIAKLDAGEIKEEVFDNMNNEMDKTFEENCRSVLKDDEYRLIFDRQADTATKASEPESTQK
ncbi:MAG: hypothetical protein Q7U02_01650 [Desulfosalsimonadaceae bacterium]|nr:hypothetical protein [Desulfosalsimonadaceae bacterium]